MEGTPRLFNQLLLHFPHTEFAALVKKHGAEHAATSFTCWPQFAVASHIAVLAGTDA